MVYLCLVPIISFNIRYPRIHFCFISVVDSIQCPFSMLLLWHDGARSSYQHSGDGCLLKEYDRTRMFGGHFERDCLHVGLLLGYCYIQLQGPMWKTYKRLENMRMENGSFNNVFKNDAKMIYKSVLLLMSSRKSYAIIFLWAVKISFNILKRCQNACTHLRK